MDDITIEEIVDLSGISEDLIESKECRDVVYCRPPDYDRPDLHVIKEVIHLKDGTSVPNLRFEYGRTRPYWITKKGFRDHQQHKENEHIDRLQMFYSTESKLYHNIGRSLRMEWLGGNKRKLFEQPYIYGVDITSGGVIKKAYKNKYKKTTEYSVCELDIETNMRSEEEEPLMCTISMKERLLTVICKDYLVGQVDPLQKIEELTMQYLGDHVTKRNIKPQSVIVNDPMEMWELIFKTVHQWQPDWLSIWNVTFEMKKFLETCERYGKDPKEIVCDPRIPGEYKSFQYIEGEKIRKMASGKTMPIRPAARWHKVIAPATFKIIDQMCVYKQTRSGMQEEPSYALDAILMKELGVGKLKFEQADHLVAASADWHTFMQTYYPLEYVVYNRFDCIGPELLDDKVKDLSLTMPSMADTSEFDRFPSQPRRAVDRLHWFLLENKERVMGVTSSAMADEYDDQTLSRNNIIITLPAALITEEGLPVILEFIDGANCRVYKDVGDLDVSASYPSAEVAGNTSKATTVREIVRIEGIPEHVFRMQNMGLSGGHVNAFEYCEIMMGFPSHSQLLDNFCKINNIDLESRTQEAYQLQMKIKVPQLA